MGSFFGNCDLKFKWLNEPKLLLKVPLEKMSDSSCENSGLNFFLESKMDVEPSSQGLCRNSVPKFLWEQDESQGAISVGAVEYPVKRTSGNRETNFL